MYHSDLWFTATWRQLVFKADQYGMLARARLTDLDINYKMYQFPAMVWSLKMRVRVRFIRFPTYVLSLPLPAKPFTARPVERGVAANIIIFIVIVCSAMVKNSFFIHKNYTPDNSVTANRNASSRNLTDTWFWGHVLCGTSKPASLTRDGQAKQDTELREKYDQLI